MEYQALFEKNYGGFFNAYSILFHKILLWVLDGACVAVLVVRLLQNTRKDVYIR